MTPVAPATSEFVDFVATAEPRLRLALGSAFGFDVGEKATAEALAFKDTPVGATVQDLVQALQAQQNSQTSVQPLELDGFAGSELVVATPDAVDLKKCYGGQRSIWRDVDGQLTDTLAPGTPITVWVLDLDGRRAVISFTAYQPMGDQAKAELAAIADSIRIG